MKPRPILYTFRRCPYAMRARMALLYAQIDFEWREIKLGNKPIEMLRLSPKGTVPVLQLGDGTVLEESIDIMLWALSQSDRDSWLSPADKQAQLLWVKSNDRDFKYALDRYKYPSRYQLDSPLPFQSAGTAWLQGLEAALKNGGFINDGRLRLVDVALFPFVRQFSRVEPDWFAELNLPAVQSWLEHCLDLPLFAQCMQKKTIWEQK